MVAAALESIAAVQNLLENSATQPVLIRWFATEQTISVVRELKARGGLARSANGDYHVDRKVAKNLRLPRSYTAATLYEWGRAPTMLAHFIASSRLSLVRLLRAFKAGVLAGDMLVPLILLRSVIEHVAISHTMVKSLHAESECDDLADVKAAVHRIHEQLYKLAYGTRVNWTAIKACPPSLPLEKKEASYGNKDDLLIDQKAGSIMNVIDELEEEVKGARVVYEVLCEFAHPNVGTMRVHSKSQRLVRDKNGVAWWEHCIQQGPPEGFLEEVGEVLPRVLKTSAECLITYEKLQSQAAKQMQKLLRLTQTITRLERFRRSSHGESNRNRAVNTGESAL
ncbi:MAG: hypothetical protein NT154_09360 [Verrucomicrobia bacterium]|nr:hypothetical protein [Verrucomicrobiota bacterium]